MSISLYSYIANNNLAAHGQNATMRWEFVKLMTWKKISAENREPYEWEPDQLCVNANVSLVWDFAIQQSCLHSPTDIHLHTKHLNLLTKNAKYVTIAPTTKSFIIVKLMSNWRQTWESIPPQKLDVKFEE